MEFALFLAFVVVANLVRLALKAGQKASWLKFRAGTELSVDNTYAPLSHRRFYDPSHPSYHAYNPKPLSTQDR